MGRHIQNTDSKCCPRIPNLRGKVFNICRQIKFESIHHQQTHNGVLHPKYKVKNTGSRGEQWERQTETAPGKSDFTSISGEVPGVSHAEGIKIHGNKSQWVRGGVNAFEVLWGFCTVPERAKSSKYLRAVLSWMCFVISTTTKIIKQYLITYQIRGEIEFLKVNPEKGNKGNKA